MKKTVIMAALCILTLGVKINATEMQIFGGFEAGFGTYKVKNDFWFYSSPTVFGFTEDTETVFFAPGLTFGVRVFSDNSPIGFIFRDRAIFMTNLKQTGKILGQSSLASMSETISKTRSAADGDFIISIMDFSPGVSLRYQISDRFQFYTDLGLNLTIMEYEEFDSDEAMKYLGLGIFSTLAVQASVTRNMYLEFGINGIMSILSNQEGALGHPLDSNQVIKYEDTGKFDLNSPSVYLSIGWRLDVEKARAQMWQTGNTEPGNTEPGNTEPGNAEP
ncbi:MAG: hypothetical protein LBF78_11390 [Treponema sp.]|jgi:hypothetical protein|nr:hypothetical protein [Treponema sp.]